MSFEDASSCICPNSWLSDNIRQYFFFYLQKLNTNVVSLSTFFSSDYINKSEWNNFYWQVTAHDRLSWGIVLIQINVKCNHWLLLVVVPLAKTVIFIDTLSYENNSVLAFPSFFKTISLFVTFLKAKLLVRVLDSSFSHLFYFTGIFFLTRTLSFCS